MSSAASLPDPKTAYDTLFGLQTRVFFQKLASFGIIAQSEKQAENLLILAGKLRLAAQSPHFKAASSGNDFVEEGINALDALLGTDKTAADVGRRKTAEALAADADIYNSLLTLKAAEATDLASQAGFVVGADGSIKAAA